MPVPFPDPTDDGGTSQPGWPQHYAARYPGSMPPLAGGAQPIRFLAPKEPEAYTPSGEPVDVCGPECAAKLDAIRERRERGGYPGDRTPHLNAHRLTFARWLVERGKLSEEIGHDNG